MFQSEYRQENQKILLLDIPKDINQKHQIIEIQ